MPLYSEKLPNLEIFLKLPFKSVFAKIILVHWISSLCVPPPPSLCRIFSIQWNSSLRSSLHCISNMRPSSVGGVVPPLRASALERWRRACEASDPPPPSSRWHPSGDLGWGWLGRGSPREPPPELLGWGEGFWYKSFGEGGSASPFSSRICQKISNFPSTFSYN